MAYKRSEARHFAAVSQIRTIRAIWLACQSVA